VSVAQSAYGGAPASGFSFRLGRALLSLNACACLYRDSDPASMIARYLVLTKDSRFAYVEAQIGMSSIYPATEWSRERALKFLVAHGEGDIVDEFPEIFRADSDDEHLELAPKNRPTEPYLFPLH
jgi:hypothetical protein